MNIIEVKDLKKYYGSIKAVDGLSFYVEKGQLFAFLGPNGAGKSTTIDIICTLLKPDDGEIIIDDLKLGKDDSLIRKKIGVVFQDSVLDKLLTVKENLAVRGSFYGLSGNKLNEAIEYAAEATNITDLLKRRYGQLSGGQRRRVDIARALINTPSILFLDEPTTGLDPQTRSSVWRTIRKLQKETGMTVFMTTHYMEEAAESDYIIIIDDGNIVAKGTPEALKEEYSKDSLKLKAKDQEQLIDVLNKQKISYKVNHDVIKIHIAETIESLPIINQCLPYISSFEVIKGTMDDVFINITGKEMR